MGMVAACGLTELDAVSGACELAATDLFILRQAKHKKLKLLNSDLGCFNDFAPFIDFGREKLVCFRRV